MDKIMYDELSEKTLINQIVNDGDILPEVELKLNKDSFYHPKLKKCYELIKEIASRGEVINFVSFTVEAKKIGFDEALNFIDSDITSSANWEYYADNIIKCEQARKLKRLLCETLEQIKPDNASELIGVLTPSIQDITYLSGELKEVSQRDKIIRLIPKIEEMLKNPASSYGYKTGLSSLDRKIGGIHNELVIITARTNMGKTILAQKMALNIARKDKVTLIELEMSDDAINTRNVSMLSGVRLNEIKYGGCAKDKIKVEQIQKALEELGSGKIAENYKVENLRNRQLSTIINYIRRDAIKNGTKAFFVDHIGLIKTDNKYGAKWEEQSEISHEFQKLQRELNIPIVLLAQRGRESEGGKAKGDLSTIRGSGSIEEDADLILIIEHARGTDKDQIDKMGAESEYIDTDIIIAKNRNGSTGVANCWFKPSYLNFVDKDN